MTVLQCKWAKTHTGLNIPDRSLAAMSVEGWTKTVDVTPPLLLPPLPVHSCAALLARLEGGGAVRLTKVMAVMGP